jgi:RNA polymerase sigma-70 factor (ECF subfamily)
MTPVDPYIVQQTSCRASQLVSAAGFSRNDWEDLKQDMILDLLRRSPKFDPARGDWQGFVRGVTRNHAAVLVMRERRRKSVLLSNDVLNPEEAGDIDALDILDTRPSLFAVNALHLRLDVRRVVARLPIQLQSVAVLLSQMRVREVCRHTGKSRSRVYQMISQLRMYFEQAGLRPTRRSVSKRSGGSQ